MPRRIAPISAGNSDHEIVTMAVTMTVAVVMVAMVVIVLGDIGWLWWRSRVDGSGGACRNVAVAVIEAAVVAANVVAVAITQLAAATVARAMVAAIFANLVVARNSTACPPADHGRCNLLAARRWPANRANCHGKKSSS